jgi:hypothetical protein
MMKKGNKDGGYYAIKGFAYQIDKFICNILNADESAEIYIENIQDISTDDYVMQVKYHENQVFSPSKIKEPVEQLIVEFQRDNTKKYYLYAHFGNFPKKSQFNASSNTISIVKINKILGKNANQYSDEIKNSFISQFTLDFVVDFQTHFSYAITLIKNCFGKGMSDDEAVFYYSNIQYFAQNLVINNQNKTDRKCMKKDIINNIKNAKKVVFTSAFKEYKNEQKYLKYIKSKFQKPKYNQQNVIFVGKNTIENDGCTLPKMVVDIVSKYFEKATYDIKPLIFIIENAEQLLRSKKQLISSDILFNDGYECIEFSDTFFNDQPIINKKSQQNGKACDSLEKISFKLKILSLENFQKIQNRQYEMIYYININEINTLQGASSLKIDDLNTTQIKNLFTS